MAETPSPLKTFLFDLDGTLIDSVELILRSYRHTLMTHLGAAPPDEQWLRGLGTPLASQLRGFVSSEADVAAMVTTYREYNEAHHDTLVREYPGVLPAVRELRSRGATLGVVTSKLRTNSRRGLARCGFDGLFDVIVAADDVARHKPHPEPVERALSLLDADARATVFIGDSPHDLAAGRAAGVRTAAALWGPFPRSTLEPHQPDHWLELPRHISELR